MNNLNEIKEVEELVSNIYVAMDTNLVIGQGGENSKLYVAILNTLTECKNKLEYVISESANEDTKMEVVD